MISKYLLIGGFLSSSIAGNIVLPAHMNVNKVTHVEIIATPQDLLNEILQNEKTENIQALVSVFENESTSCQAAFYHDIFEYCLQHKKIHIAIELVKNMPSYLFKKNVSSISVTQLGPWLLKEAITHEHTALVTEIVKKMATRLIFCKDEHGLKATDYAERTGNTEIIDILHIKNVRKIKRTVKQDSLFLKTFKKHPIVTTAGIIILPLIMLCGLSTYVILTLTLPI